MSTLKERLSNLDNKLPIERLCDLLTSNCNNGTSSTCPCEDWNGDCPIAKSGSCIEVTTISWFTFLNTAPEEDRVAMARGLVNCCNNGNCVLGGNIHCPFEGNCEYVTVGQWVDTISISGEHKEATTIKYNEVLLNSTCEALSDACRHGDKCLVGEQPCPFGDVYCSSITPEHWKNRLTVLIVNSSEV